MSSDPGIFTIIGIIPIATARAAAALLQGRLLIAPALNQILTAIPKALTKRAQTSFKVIKGVRNLIANLTATAQHLLPNAGAIQGEIIELLQRRLHLPGLLIDQAIGFQTPAATMSKRGSLRATR